MSALGWRVIPASRSALRVVAATLSREKGGTLRYGSGHHDKGELRYRRG